MDLYSAARRYAKPHPITRNGGPRSLRIADHGLIGDGQTAALVGVDGSIDWLCFPRFDSPAVFAAVLDPQRGGSTSVAPSADNYDSLQAYDPDTNVLETLFTVPGQGVVRLTDYMPWNNDPRASIHEVHRRIECRSGEVEMEALFDPRFGYGARVPRIEIAEHGVRAHTPQGESLVGVLDCDVKWKPRPEGGVRTRFSLRADETAWFILSWDAPTPEPISSYRPFEQLRTTRHHWREWARQLNYDGPYRHHVMRSALVLKLMIHAPTGAMVAAPTTSLPEWLGGGRNWDYRYTWTRDTAMGIRAANRIGYGQEARDFFHFVRDALTANPELQVMYSIDGAPVPDEHVLGHLAGHRGALPVRIGNGARDQLQLDTAGALLDAAVLYEHTGGNIGLRAWRPLRHVVNTVAQNWQQPDHGIWEPRSGVRHNVHSKLMSWLALERGQQLAMRFGDNVIGRQWGEASSLLRSEVLDNGFDPTGKHFVSVYGGDDVDAALLALPLDRVLPRGDRRIDATIDAVRNRLGDGAFLHRYRAEDGVGGDEGAFLLCGFWLSEALARTGRLAEAQEVFVAHAEASNHLGLLSEEIDPSSGELLGNFPQAFSHLGLINAALGIDRVLRQRDEAPSLGEPE